MFALVASLSMSNAPIEEWWVFKIVLLLIQERGTHLMFQTTKDTYAPISMQSLVEEIINSPTPYPTPEDKDAVQKMVMDLAKYARNLEKRIYGLVQYLSRMNTHALDVLPSDEDEDRVGRLADFLGTVSVSKPEKRFFGKSSMISLWKLTLEMERNRRLEETQESEDDDATDVEAVATPEFLTIYPPVR